MKQREKDEMKLRKVNTWLIIHIFQKSIARKSLSGKNAETGLDYYTFWIQVYQLFYQNESQVVFTQKSFLRGVKCDDGYKLSQLDFKKRKSKCNLACYSYSTELCQIQTAQTL